MFKSQLICVFVLFQPPAEELLIALAVDYPCDRLRRVTLAPALPASALVGTRLAIG